VFPSDLIWQCYCFVWWHEKCVLYNALWHGRARSIWNILKFISLDNNSLFFSFIWKVLCVLGIWTCPSLCNNPKSKQKRHLSWKKQGQSLVVLNLLVHFFIFTKNIQWNIQSYQIYMGDKNPASLIHSKYRLLLPQ